MKKNIKAIDINEALFSVLTLSVLALFIYMAVEFIVYLI
jgi:hypothetical protein